MLFFAAVFLAGARLLAVVFRTGVGCGAPTDLVAACLADRLRAEQQLIDANLTRIDAEAQSARAAIATYRAFGGGPAIETTR